MGIVSLSHETILEVAWIPRHIYYGHKAKKKSPCPSDKAEKSGNSGIGVSSLKNCELIDTSRDVMIL